MISKYDTFVWPRHVRWLFYTNVDSNVQLKVTATAVIIRKRGWFSRIPFCVLLCAFYNNSDAFLMPMTSLMIPQQPKINPFYIILYLLPLIFFFENGIRMEITFYLCWYWYLIQCIHMIMITSEMAPQNCHFKQCELLIHNLIPVAFMP